MKERKRERHHHFDAGEMQYPAKYLEVLYFFPFLFVFTACMFSSEDDERGERRERECS